MAQGLGPKVQGLGPKGLGSGVEDLGRRVEEGFRDGVKGDVVTQHLQGYLAHKKCPPP